MHPKDLKKLGDLYGLDLAGWQIGPCYYLELLSNVMGIFPAVLSSDQDQIILTLDASELRRVWEGLPRRNAKVTKFNVIAHPASGIAFNVEHDKREHVKPLRIFSTDEIKALCEEEGAIRWANGLFDLNPGHVFDPAFP